MANKKKPKQKAPVKPQVPAKKKKK